MEKKELDIYERRQIQLDMLFEVDAFCRKNGIKYILAFGSLIGAIRHKGFIPWDDDMDICMPVDDISRFKNEFKSDLVQVIDVDSDKNYFQAFPRLVHKATYSILGKHFKSYGVCIDMYPCFECIGDINTMQSFFNSIMPYSKKASTWTMWSSRLLRRLPINNIPGLNSHIKAYRDYLFSHCQEHGSGKYYIYGGELDFSNVYDFNIFEKLIDVNFEDRVFWAPACYDKYLTKFYGDYMTPPPVNEQVPYHSVNKYFWR